MNKANPAVRTKPVNVESEDAASAGDVFRLAQLAQMAQIRFSNGRVREKLGEMLIEKMNNAHLKKVGKDLLAGEQADEDVKKLQDWAESNVIRHKRR